MRKNPNEGDGWMTKIPKKVQHGLPAQFQRACTMSRLAITAGEPRGGTSSRSVYGAVASASEHTYDVWRKGSQHRWERERPRYALCDAGDNAGMPPACGPDEQRAARGQVEQTRPREGDAIGLKGLGDQESDDLDAMERAMLGEPKKPAVARPKKAAASSDPSSADGSDEEDEDEDDDGSDDEDDSSSAPAPRPTKPVANTKVVMKAMKVTKVKN